MYRQTKESDETYVYSGIQGTNQNLAVYLYLYLRVVVNPEKGRGLSFWLFLLQMSKYVSPQPLLQEIVPSRRHALHTPARLEQAQRHRTLHTI